ncbi:hypothetical protein SLE2022_034190 [Rubroshorea leprosula]
MRRSNPNPAIPPIEMVDSQVGNDSLENEDIELVSHVNSADVGSPYNRPFRHLPEDMKLEETSGYYYSLRLKMLFVIFLLN